MLDHLYDALPADVLGAELDTCWLYSGRVDPAAYIRTYADRAPIIHLKDCVKDGGRAGFKPVGSGVLDWNAIFDACGKAEWVCVEQDDPSDGLDAFACAAASAGFVTKIIGNN
jgi:sugar phosphate isomerase/epimerase